MKTVETSSIVAASAGAYSFFGGLIASVNPNEITPWLNLVAVFVGILSAIGAGGYQWWKWLRAIKKARREDALNKPPTL